uniref:Uncharacterized protein n=1 Tax=Arundo donax TaxID=35708 RepID=A0A0A9CGE8_ARUDO
MKAKQPKVQSCFCWDLWFQQHILHEGKTLFLMNFLR